MLRILDEASVTFRWYFSFLFKHASPWILYVKSRIALVFLWFFILLLFYMNEIKSFSCWWERWGVIFIIHKIYVYILYFKALFIVYLLFIFINLMLGIFGFNQNLHSFILIKSAFSHLNFFILIFNLLYTNSSFEIIYIKIVFNSFKYRLIKHNVSWSLSIS